VQSYAVKYPIIYNHPGKEFVIRLGDANNKGYKDYMMCEVPKSTAKEQLKEENNLILQVIDHVCKRDEQGLVASTNIIINKIQAIANLNLTLLEEIQTMDHFFPKIIAYYNFDEDKKKRRKQSARRYRKFPTSSAINQSFYWHSSSKWKKKSENDKAGPVLLSIYQAYKVMQKAKYPSTPLTFD